MVGCFACASTARIPPDGKYQIHVIHENNTFERSTIYLLDGTSRQRIMGCDGLARCQYWINPVRSAQILNKGYIELGWRLTGQDQEFAWSDVERPLFGRGRMDVYNRDVVVVIVIDNTYTWIFRAESDTAA